MGVMSEFDLQLQEIREVMRQEIDLDEVHVESTIHSVISQLDDLLIALNEPAHVDYLLANKASIGLAVRRANLLSNLIAART